MMRLNVPALALLLCAVAPAATAQRTPEVPARPFLTQSADTNDWNAYYVHGLMRFNEQPREAYAAFYWANRLNPESAEALYGQWATFWMSDLRRFIGYLVDEPSVTSNREVIRNDSLIYRALQINPLLHTALDHRMMEQAYRFVNQRLRWDQLDPYTAGMVHYNKGEMGPAAEKFRTVVQRRARQRSEGRLALARAHFFLGNHDSSATHFTTLLEEMRQRDEKKVVYWYQNKAIMEYSIGHIYLDAKRYDEAKEAYGRALTEDLSFHMAHARLGNIARMQGDTGIAVHELGLAVELRNNEPGVLAAYGAALIDAKRAAEAEPHLRKAVELEPFQAIAWYQLARSLDEQAKAADAIEQYTNYLARAPRSQTREITLSRRRMAVLRSMVASGTN